MTKKKIKINKRSFNKILFVLFLFFLPTQLGKHFFLPFSYISGVRVDFLAPTVYTIDIVVLLLLILNLKTVWNFFNKRNIVIFFVLSILNIVFAKVPVLAIYGFLRTTEFLVIFTLVPSLKKIIKDRLFLITLFVSTTIETFLVIYQLIFKQSIQGIFYFLGERLLSLSSPGVAKISLGGVEFLRPYGTFSHPNSLGGFYLLWYFFILTEKKFDKHPLLKYILVFLFTILIFFSFSKIAIGTFILLNLVWIFRTGLKCKICAYSRAVTLIVLGTIFFQGKGDLLTVSKRVELMSNAFSIITKHPLFGTGYNNYLVFQTAFISKIPLFINQPVHNIFLLFLAETGIIIGGFIFYSLLRLVFKKPLRKDQWLLIIVVVVTGFFDHYWLTLVQNFLLLAVVFSIDLGDRVLSED